MRSGCQALSGADFGPEVSRDTSVYWVQEISPGSVSMCVLLQMLSFQMPLLTSSDFGRKSFFLFADMTQSRGRNEERLKAVGRGIAEL